MIKSITSPPKIKTHRKCLYVQVDVYQIQKSKKDKKETHTDQVPSKSKRKFEFRACHVKGTLPFNG